MTAPIAVALFLCLSFGLSSGNQDVRATSQFLEQERHAINHRGSDNRHNPTLTHNHHGDRRHQGDHNGHSELRQPANRFQHDNRQTGSGHDDRRHRSDHKDRSDGRHQNDHKVHNDGRHHRGQNGEHGTSQDVLHTQRHTHNVQNSRGAHTASHHDIPGGRLSHHTQNGQEQNSRLTSPSNHSLTSGNSSLVQSAAVQAAIEALAQNNIELPLIVAPNRACDPGKRRDRSGVCRTIF